MEAVFYKDYTCLTFKIRLVQQPCFSADRGMQSALGRMQILGRWVWHSHPGENRLRKNGIVKYGVTEDGATG